KTYETTEVYFREIEEDEINRYIDTGEAFDKAGGYAIQGIASLFIKKIHGDYHNVVGLPIYKLNEILKNEFNINLI
ncbi:MAG: Maf-like protein, partial [Clostridiales bacterium]|nr:Maf-like protein [Clostridiales bacterium]